MDAMAKTTISRWREVEEDESEDDGEVERSCVGVSSVGTEELVP